MKDETVIAAIARRDEQAMGAVIDKFSRLLWPIARAVLENVGCEQDAEECVADAFIYLWEHPDKFDPRKGSLKSWLCIVVRSRAIDRFRELTRRGTLPLEEAVLAQTLGLQEAAMQRETRRELLAAVNALGEPGREILVRRYYYNQKPRQIALALGMTVKQVDNSLYRSKRLLRERLTAAWGGAK
ncbi:MAG: sigma-70 family RNA polymerase sigma factor [Faecousia sp.]